MVRTQKSPTTKIYLLAPVVGTAIFIVIYIIATTFSPGGSQADKNAVGFSWANNYWCNLLNENAINGQHNPARPIAISGRVILCVTLSFFWLQFPRYMKVGKRGRLVIQVPGTVAMAAALLLFSNFNHDLITTIASGFGVIATIGTFIALYKTRWYRLFAFGLVNIILVAINNYVYYNKALIIYLPIVQKITFAFFLIWVCSINLCLYRNSISR